GAAQMIELRESVREIVVPMYVLPTSITFRPRPPSSGRCLKLARVTMGKKAAVADRGVGTTIRCQSENVGRTVLIALGVAEVQADNGSNRRENADGNEEEGKHQRSNPRAMPTTR